MNLELMTIEQLKVLAYDTSIELQRIQYNMQLIVNEINKKSSTDKASEIFKNIKENSSKQEITEVESKINESDQ